MIKRYYYAEQSDKTLKVTLNDLCLGFMPLIWCNAGLYGIISKEKVENIIQLLQDQGKLPRIEKINRYGTFYWDEVVELDQKIGKLL